MQCKIIKKLLDCDRNVSQERDVAVPTANRRQSNVAPEKNREESVLHNLLCCPGMTLVTENSKLCVSPPPLEFPISWLRQVPGEVPGVSHLSVQDAPCSDCRIHHDVKRDLATLRSQCYWARAICGMDSP